MNQAILTLLSFQLWLEMERCYQRYCCRKTNGHRTGYFACSTCNDFYPEGYQQMYFTQNHDENTWTGTENDLYGASAAAFNVLMFTWQGIPMLYNGQEDGLDQRLAFFKKDPIKWGDYHKTPFFQNLCDLRHNNKALRVRARMVAN